MDLDMLARRQHHVVSRAQALDAGMSEKAIRCRLDSGRWRRVHRGVYQVHTGEVTWLSRASAAVLRLGSDATLALTAAAYLWSLRDRPPPVIPLVVPSHRTVVRPPGTRVRRRERIERSVVRSLPVTSVAQTVVDLADAPGTTALDAVALAARACQEHRTSAEAVTSELSGRRAHRHRAALMAGLEDIGGGVESVAEHVYVRAVERAHRLPTFERQAPLPGDRCEQAAGVQGRAGERTDFRSRTYGVIVEIDGRRWHTGPALHADRRRDRQASANGQVTLRAGWLDVAEHPCDLALDIVRTLWARGWTGRPSACSAGCTVNRLGQSVETR